MFAIFHKAWFGKPGAAAPGAWSLYRSNFKSIQQAERSKHYKAAKLVSINGAVTVQKVGGHA